MCKSQGQVKSPCPKNMVFKVFAQCLPHMTRRIKVIGLRSTGRGHKIRSKVVWVKINVQSHTYMGHVNMISNTLSKHFVESTCNLVYDGLRN